MSDQLIVALEDCLARMEQGADLESCLAYYPELAAELRPLLLAAMDAESLAEKDVPLDRVRRSKARFLNVAAGMREQKSTRKAVLAPPFRRTLRFSLVVMIVLILMAGIGGTGLVRASNRSLPGDQLYPIKLTWENLQLKLAVAPSEKKALENQFEHERVKEINGLISVGRSESVHFFGQVEGVFPNQLIVSGVTVTFAPDTRVDGGVQMNAWVRVEGVTQPNGAVLAKSIKVVPADTGGGGQNPTRNSTLPSGGEDANKGNENSNGGESGGSGTPKGERSKGPETPRPDSTVTSEPENTNSGNEQNDQSTPEPRSFEVEGVVTSYNGNVIVVGNKSILITSGTEFHGTPVAGSAIRIRGYVGQDGTLIALRIELKSTSGPGGGGGGGGEGGSGGGGDEGGGHPGGSGGDGPTRTPNPNETPDH